MRRLLPHLLSLLLPLAAGCNGCGTPRGMEITAQGHVVPTRDPIAELWALGPPTARLALVIPDLRALLRLGDDLRLAAIHAPRGPAAVTHLDTMLKVACPSCPRRAAEWEAAGLRPSEGLALYATPGGERVLALGCTRAEAALAVLESWLRRLDHTVRRREIVRGAGERLLLLEGVNPWYCRQVRARLVCGSTPAVLDAALRRRPPDGLWAQRLAGRFPLTPHDHQALLYVAWPFAPDVWALSVEPDRVRLRVLTRPLPGAPHPPPGRPSTLLGLAEGADGVTRLNLALPGRGTTGGEPLLDELRRLLGRGGAGALEALDLWTGELLAFKRGPFGFSLALGLTDGAALRPRLSVLLRALQLLRFTQRLRGVSGPLELLGAESIEVEELPAAAITLRLHLQEPLALRSPLSPTIKLYVGTGPDCLVVTTEREVLRRALRPARRRPDALWRATDERHLERTFGGGALFAFWSRALDPFSGLPASLVDAKLEEALREHRDLRDTVQAARFLADLVHDVSVATTVEQQRYSTELVVRPLHVDDAAHRRTRPAYLRALAARYRGERDIFQRGLGALLADAPGTRYAERARLLAAGDPLSLIAVVAGAAAATHEELWRLLQRLGTRRDRPPGRGP